MGSSRVVGGLVFCQRGNGGTETLLSPFLGCRCLEGLSGKLSGLAGVWTRLERGQ